MVRTSVGVKTGSFSTLQLIVRLQGISKSRLQLPRALKPQLLPTLEIETYILLQLVASCLLVGDENEIILLQSFAAIESLQIANLVIDVAVTVKPA